MATNRVKTEAEILELFRVSLDNVEDQPGVSTVMAEFGFDSEKIKEGKSYYTNARQAFDSNKIEDDEMSAAYNDFSTERQKLADTYAMHRKKAKVVFRKDPVTAEKLGITGIIPQAYIKWLETVKKFYSTAIGDPSIRNKLTRLKIAAVDLNTADTMIKSVEKARAEYLKEKGESQDATKIKDAALAKLDDWMSEFYAVARIGLEDNPQLLESLGILVKS